MADVEPMHLSADGHPACAQPEQVPKNGLMAEYLKLRADKTVAPLSSPADIGTAETFLRDNKPIFKAQLATVEEMKTDFQKKGLPLEAVPKQDVLVLDDLAAGRSERYEGNARVSARFPIQGDNGLTGLAEATLDGATVKSEFIWQPSDQPKHPVTSIDFGKDGTPDRVLCMSDQLSTTYKYNMPYDSWMTHFIENLNVASNKALTSSMDVPSFILPW